MKNKSNNYWNTFYKNKKIVSKLNFPSQFAVFTLSEKQNENTVIEIGCGNGRDSFFFSKYFKNIHAFDKSDNAIKYNRNNYKRIKNLNFYEYDINENFEFFKLKKLKKILYARFFLHSLNNNEILKFINLSSKLINKNEKIFLEYRVLKDKNSKKIFKKHFRNYLNPKEIAKFFIMHSFKLDYDVVSQGFAKYGLEDPFVARQIFIKK